ncbi:phage portal protein [Ornithinimicrobium sp. LYQ92]|uniref:phage portal protein n=1 Tax=Serinicoccus sp. LYQ92 TaxID=3378798 RepID=UPI003853DD20
MTIDVKTKDSPGWYLKRLSDKLHERQPLLTDLFDRYEGNAPVPSSLNSAPESARAFFKASRTAFAEMVVKAVKYPLKLQAVTTAADDNETGDTAAWRMLVRSGMLSEADDVVRTMLVAGDGYAFTSMHEGQPTYTAEDPRQVVTIHDPVVQAKIIAAGKFFYHPEDEASYAYLYRKGRVWRAVYPGRRTTGAIRFGPSWSWDETYGGVEGTALPDAELMPVFRYRNEEGVGEFKRHRDLLDRMDHMVLQGMSIATYQAFKQRAIKIDDEDLEDEDGDEVDLNDVLSADPGAVWKLPSTAELWESGNVDLTPVWTGMEKFIQQLSAVTFTPLAMFSPDGQNQSAAGAAFAREGRTFKIEDRQARVGFVHALALSALFRLGNDADRTPVEDIEIVWRPAERYGLSEKADAATKYKAAGTPWRTIMGEVLQFTPRQIVRMESERLDDEMLVASLAMSGAEQAADDQVSAEDVAAIKARADALGTLIRAGVDPVQAAQQAGYSTGLRFTGRPVALQKTDAES